MPLKTWSAPSRAPRHLPVEVVRIVSPEDCALARPPTIGSPASICNTSRRRMRVMFPPCLRLSSVPRLKDEPDADLDLAALAVNALARHLAEVRARQVHLGLIHH